MAAMSQNKAQIREQEKEIDEAVIAEGNDDEA